MSKLSPFPLQIEGLPQQLQMQVHGDQDQYVSRRIREQGVWEPYETALVMATLDEGSVFVDVGSNLGYFALIAASLVGDSGAVYAFEPDPENFRLLQDNARLNGFTQCIDCCEGGLAAANGRGRLYLSTDNFGDHKIYQGDHDRPSVDIELFNGAEYLSQRTDRIDLIKVDTQGSEFAVMSGLMPLLLELPAMPRILIELTPLSLRQAGASGRQLVELLAELDQTMWIVNHLEHRLVAHSSQDLSRWCDDVDSVAGDEGFMNILIGPQPGH